MPRAAPGSGIPIDVPVTVIGPGRHSIAAKLRELWAYRELLYFLVLRDVKVRYRQTLLGVAWALLQPLLAMILFTFFFGKLAQIPSDGVPYALFAYVGLLPWTFFSNAILESGNSLIRNPDLISKVYIPRVMVPSTPIVAGILDMGIAFLCLAVLMAYYGVSPGVGILALPLLFLLTITLAMGVGMLFAALNVKYRDIRFALPFLVQLWLFASPVIYPLSLVPQRWRPLVMLNPLSGIITGYRSALLDRPFDWYAVGTSALIVACVLLAAFRYFRKVEAEFADYI